LSSAITAIVAWTLERLKALFMNSQSATLIFPFQAEVRVVKRLALGVFIGGVSSFVCAEQCNGNGESQGAGDYWVCAVGAGDLG
jgi:hypothetical protein